MTSPNLSRGQNAVLPASVTRINAVVGWYASGTAIDVSALLLGANRKVGVDSDFVFYNQPTSPDGSVRLLGTITEDNASWARIAIDLSAVPDRVHTVALVGSLDIGSFGDLGELVLRIQDESGRLLAEYTIDETTVERALVFGEVYKRGSEWKVRAVGQGWETGLAGLATDFGVDVDDAGPDFDAGGVDSASAEGPETSSAGTDLDLTEHVTGRTYRLWGQNRSWCDYEIAFEKEYEPAIRSLFSPNFLNGDENRTLDVELVPESDGPRGSWAVSVRAEGKTVGYIESDDAQRWSAVIRRIVASGLIPTTSGRIWVSEFDGWDGIELRTSVRILLGNPAEAIPLNQPPAVDYTMIPRSAIVQVTKEEEHFDTLLKYVPPQGYGLLYVTLHERLPDTGRAKSHVEVRIDGKRIGQLTPQMSQRFLPMIRHLKETRDLVTACWADITGSAVAAKVRIDGIKANEAPREVLEGPPTTIPSLMEEKDPLTYSLKAMRARLAPRPLVRFAPRPLPPQPPDGAIVRFDKSRGHYHFVAVRRGDRWETTASGGGRSISEVMKWADLAARVCQFDIVTAWAEVDRRGDARTLENLAVVRFTVNGRHLAAINVCENGSADGEWYTTLAECDAWDEHFRYYADWNEIMEHGRRIEVAIGWESLGPVAPRRYLSS